MTRIIVNLTQHQATQSQREAGVFDLDPSQRQELTKLLTFDAVGTASNVLALRGHRRPGECHTRSNLHDRGGRHS